MFAYVDMTQNKHEAYTLKHACFNLHACRKCLGEPVAVYVARVIFSQGLLHFKPTQLAENMCRTFYGCIKRGGAHCRTLQSTVKKDLIGPFLEDISYPSLSLRDLDVGLEKPRELSEVSV